MTPEEKLKDLGIELPEVRSFHPAMAPGVITGNLLYLSGATLRPATVSPGAGASARPTPSRRATKRPACARSSRLAQAKAVLGDLSRITRVVKVLGMVNCVPGFEQTPQVMHGFSELLYEVFGERGVHARSAVGLQALPSNVPIEVENVSSRLPEPARY